jgi:hypothetical protein
MTKCRSNGWLTCCASSTTHPTWIGCAFPKDLKISFLEFDWLSTSCYRLATLGYMLNPQNEKAAYVAITSKELEVDDQGRVWRVMKRTYDRWTKGVKTTRCKRVRAESVNTAGYLQVRVMRDSKRIYAAAHRLVWLHFKGEIPLGMTVNHKNGNKADNRMENLELATMSEQRIHAIRVLNCGRTIPRGELNPKHQATESMVAEIRRRHDAGEKEIQLAADFGMTRRAVWAICHRKTWRHIA